MAAVQVLNVEDLSQDRWYTLAPREAVIAAYAQMMRRDWNTWDYEAKYGGMVRQTRHGWVCGSFWCLDPEVEARMMDGPPQRPAIGQEIDGSKIARLVAWHNTSHAWEIKADDGRYIWVIDVCDANDGMIWQIVHATIAGG